MDAESNVQGFFPKDVVIVSFFLKIFVFWMLLELSVLCALYCAMFFIVREIQHTCMSLEYRYSMSE